MWGAIFNWFTGGNVLTDIFKTIDTAVDNETQRQAIKSQLAQTYLNAQVQVLIGRGWWFPLLFLVPAGFWFSSVCVYSVWFCHNCILPQSWSIAALPPPLDSWMAAIIGSLFIGKAGEAIIARLK